MIKTAVILFRYHKRRKRNLRRKRFTSVVKVNHQSIAPENIPKIARAVLSKEPSSRMLNPDSIAVKNRIVKGFDIVKKKTDIKSLRSLLLFCCCRACLMVFEKKRKIPKIIKTNPPPRVR